MGKEKINEQILEGIRENSGNDIIIKNFLIDLILEEVNHTGTWWWKDIYKQRVDKFSGEWEDFDED